MKDEKEVELFIDNIGNNIKKAILDKMDRNLDNFLVKGKEMHPDFEWNKIKLYMQIMIAKHEKGVKTDKTENVMSLYLDLSPELFFTKEELEKTNYKEIKSIFEI